MPETRLQKHYQVMNINATEITLLYLEYAQYGTPTPTGPETPFDNLFNISGLYGRKREY